MRPTALLVNTARGGVVDTEALVGRCVRAGSAARRSTCSRTSRRSTRDCWELERVVLTPHLGSAGDATRSAMCRLAVRNVAEVLAGDPPLTPV